MPSACASRGDPIAALRPSMAMAPASRAYAPFRVVTSVDLPAPFSPSSTCTSPARRSKSTPASATTPGNVLRMPRMASTGARSIRKQMNRSFDVITMGRSSIDLYAHQIGVPMTEVTSFDAYVGGCPTNISVGTRRLGLKSALLTAVGDDEVGDFVLAFLKREGVETRYIPRKRGARTSAVVMSIQPPDRFPLTFYREGCADRQLTVDDVDRAAVGAAAMLVVTGTGLSHQPSRAAARHAARRARDAGRRVLVDIDYRPDQWTDRAAFQCEVQGRLREAHLAVGTEEEVVAATGLDDPDAAARRLLGLGL